MLKLNDLKTSFLSLFHGKQKEYFSVDNLEDLKKDLDTDSAMERHTHMSSDVDFDSSEKIGAALESFADQGPNEAASNLKSERPVFSKVNIIFTVVLVLSLVGFSSSNWMMRNHLGQLTATTADLQSSLTAMHEEKIASENNMLARIAGLEDSFRQVRLKLGQQSGDDSLVALELRLVEAEKEISRLRLVMHSTTKHKRIKRAKAPVVTQKIQRTANAAKHTPPKPKTALASRTPPVSTSTHSPPISKSSGQNNWFVNLATRSDELAADSELKKIRASGMMAGKHGVNVRGKKYWRLSVAGFPSRQAAHKFIQNVAAKHGFPDAWVYQMSSR